MGDTDTENGLRAGSDIRTGVEVIIRAGTGTATGTGTGAATGTGTGAATGNGTGAATDAGEEHPTKSSTVASKLAISVSDNLFLGCFFNFAPPIRE